MTTTMTGTSTAAATGDLLKRIEAFEIDEGAPALTFEARLARENGWRGNYAGRVIIEYKRFVYLAMAAGHPVTPSDQVDQAWHLHLTYSRSYWDRLCGQVLGRPLHHGPTRGGEDEDEKFNDWYEKTKDSYRRIFREEPPIDLWPPAHVRFGEDVHFARVNTARNWVVPKRDAQRWARRAAVLVALPAMAGCAPLLLGAGSDVAMIAFAAVVVLMLLLALAARVKKGAAGCGSAASGCGGGWWFFDSPSGGDSGGHHGCGGDTGGHSGCSSGSGGCGSSGCGSSGCGGGGCGGGGCGGGGCGS